MTPGGRRRIPRGVVACLAYGCLILVAASVRGDSFVVDNSGSPPCADSPAGGSELAPWCTISYAVGRLQAGDHLLVSSGTYTGSVFIANLVGSPSLVTIIEAAPGAQVIIQGPGVDGGRVRIDGCHYLELKGFEVTNFNQGVFVQGASSNITLSDLEVHFVGQEGMHVKENSWDVLIYSCFIYDTDQWLYNGEGIYIGTGSGGPLDNTHHVTVRGCVIHDTVDEAVELKPGTHDCLVEGNLVYNVTTAPSFGAIEVNQHINGVQTWSQDPAHIVRDNVVHDTDTAIRAGTGCQVSNELEVASVAGFAVGDLVELRQDNDESVMARPIVPPEENDSWAECHWGWRAVGQYLLVTAVRSA